MSSGPSEIMAAIKAGLATVTNLSAATVSVNDWTVRNNPYSVIIFPSLGGQQEMAAAGEWWVTHKIKCKLTIRHNDVKKLHDNAATMIPLVLAWFRANDGLGLADVVTCHLQGGALTWASPSGDNVYDDGGGVLSREIDFSVSVVTSI
jgi:hypothetical protein